MKNMKNMKNGRKLGRAPFQRNVVVLFIVLDPGAEGFGGVAPPVAGETTGRLESTGFSVDKEPEVWHVMAGQVTPVVDAAATTPDLDKSHLLKTGDGAGDGATAKRWVDRRASLPEDIGGGVCEVLI